MNSHTQNCLALTTLLLTSLLSHSALAGDSGSDTASTPKPLSIIATCQPNPSVDIKAESYPPCDFPTKTKTTQLNLARFAWNTFISLNWPAQSPFKPPYTHGVPTGTTYANADSVVWDSWREKRELYQIRSTSTNTGY